MKNFNKNYNNENNKTKKNTNKSFDISSAINLKNKNKNIQKINFNNKNEIFFQKKIIEKNKNRSNSSNNVIIKDNNKKEIKNIKNRRNGNENSFPFLNKMPFLKDMGVDNPEFYIQICKTYQNQKKLQKNKDNNDNINSLKDLKVKEMTLFLKKCKIYLEPNLFDKIMKVFQDYKNGSIPDDIIIQKIKEYLINNNELLNSFKNIIS